MRIAIAVLALLLLVPHVHAVVANNRGGTTNNDDSCDIGNAPAATLLLPYFEVDPLPGTPSTTTLFTVTNVGAQPRIIHITLWTDLSYPALSFSLPLHGHDVQSINLHDVIVRGVIPTGGGDGSCAALPNSIPPSTLDDLQRALTTGTVSSCGSERVGLEHPNAIGYVTVDVTAICSTTLPTSASYYSHEILFDNVLIGDYQQVAPGADGQYAQGNPMVHLRAVPEGGAAGAAVLTNLPYTFYDRYTAGLSAPFNRTQDRRQPLPSTFVARWIHGVDALFQTDYKIWREGVTGSEAACSSYRANSGKSMVVGDLVRFDEHENPTILAIAHVPGRLVVVRPATSRTIVSSFLLPQPASPTGDQGGWMYLNMSNEGAAAYSVTTAGVSESVAPAKRGFGVFSRTAVGVRQSQAWVVVSMYAAGRYAAEFDAAWLGNGCSPTPWWSNSTTNPIAPAPDLTP